MKNLLLLFILSLCSCLPLEQRIINQRSGLLECIKAPSVSVEKKSNCKQQLIILDSIYSEIIIEKIKESK